MKSPVRITDVISSMALNARLRRMSPLIIAMPPPALVSLAFAIEVDFGYVIFRRPMHGFQYAGVSFIPMWGKPRIRVKARTQKPSAIEQILQQAC